MSRRALAVVPAAKDDEKKSPGQLPSLAALRRALPLGAPFAPNGFFQSLGGQKINTGVYVFAINPADNSVHWGFGRKIPPNRRVPFKYLKSPRGHAFRAMYESGKPGARQQALQQFDPPLAGAAGTNTEYHGKWASLGGGSDPASTSFIDAARIELNDEAAVTPPLQMHEIFVPGTTRPFLHGTSRAVLVGCDRPNPNGNVYIFVFKWHDFNEFIALFPPIDDKTAVRGGPIMAKRSHGEIDYAQSMTPDQMLARCAEAQTSGSNFFTSYTLRSFIDIAMPIVARHSTNILQPRGKQPLVLRQQAFRALSPVLTQPDTTPRNPNGWRDQWLPYVT